MSTLKRMRQYRDRNEILQTFVYIQTLIRYLQYIFFKIKHFYLTLLIKCDTFRELGRFLKHIQGFGFGEPSFRVIFANGIPAFPKCKNKGTSSRLLYLEMKIVKYC